jgi:hypothetical protein
MKLTKDNLFKVVADLIEMVKEFGQDDQSIIDVLCFYGFTKEQLNEWYGLQGE